MNQINNARSTGPFDYAKLAEEDLYNLLSHPEIEPGIFPTAKKSGGYEWIRVTGGSERWIKVPGDASITSNNSEGQLGLRLKRPLTFDKTENDFLESYSKALTELKEAEGKDYFEDAKASLVARAIAGQVSSALNPQSPELARNVVVEALSFLQQATSVTYEGQRLKLNVIYDASVEAEATQSHNEPLYTLGKYRMEPWYPTLGSNDSNAILLSERENTVYVEALHDLSGTTVVSADYSGDEVPNDTESRYDLAPESLQNLNRWSTVQGRVGFSLFPSGDIAVVLGGTIRYVYRQGQWRTFQLKNVMERSWGASKLKAEIKAAVVQTALDASFHRHGGSIAVVSSGRSNDFNIEIRKQNRSKGVASAHLRRDEAKNQPTAHSVYWQQAGGKALETETVEGESWKLLPDRRRSLLERGGQSAKFQDLARSQRLELLSMDGATIIDHAGNILGVGVIFPLSSTDQGGGRESAAKTLATFGSAFKISQDGPITLYGYGKGPAGNNAGVDGNAGNETADSSRVIKFG